MSPPIQERSTLGLHSLEQYEPIVGRSAVERIGKKIDVVRTMQVTHVSSTFYGGGVTKNLTPLTLMMNATEAAARIVQVLKNSRLREVLGSQARETVREKFLMSRPSGGLARLVRQLFRIGIG